ncbi:MULTISPECIES: hypothetical protein [Streptomyces]|uniref:Secreted protein n=1 Tax=Streptomyces griseiscabiei TaxID=2993540 RepID=A0ABU4L8X3_9ACTN|nr:MULTISPECIES: hypothetical protein [Streptomyces]MBZ3903458.1 hypothetical protein [Streptomyces griseiscabiei]MDX2912201.1 hypothetical protein [Streptomyces griseiscabiei]
MSAAAGALLLVASGGVSQAADVYDEVRKVTDSAELTKHRLLERRVSTATIAELDSRLPNVGVGDVLASANHPMKSVNSGQCAAREAKALPVKPGYSSGYCWDTGDAITQRWLPQGLTSSGDADNDGLWGTNKVILSGWKSNDTGFFDEYDPSKTKYPNSRNLTRVAFIDANDPSAMKYRWVLLVVPTEGGANFDNLGANIGGMAWFGDKLMITAKGEDSRDNALFVFSMKHILQATVNDDAIGRVSGGYSAHGYQYVMPAIGSYGLMNGGCGTASGIACAASMSVDRSATPDSIVLNEWHSSSAPKIGRTWSYRLAAPSEAGMPLEVDASGYAKVSEMYTADMSGVQGALWYTDPATGKRSWYLPKHRGGPGQQGVYYNRDTQGRTTTSCTGTDSSGACWAAHSQGMSLWWNGKTVWSQTEWAANASGKWIDEAVAGWQSKVVRERVLFSVPLSSMP